MALATYYLDYGRHVARLRRRRRRAYAPTSNTASHDNHEKINSWVSFAFLYAFEYGTPLGGPSGRLSSAKMNNDRADGHCCIAAALSGFNDLGRSVTPTFLCRNRFYSQLSPHCPKMNKNQYGKLKKIQDFCPRDIESCHLAAAMRVKLWSLKTNLLFKEPHQLTKFT